MTHWAAPQSPLAMNAPRAVVAASWLQRGRPGLKTGRPSQPAQ